MGHSAAAKGRLGVLTIDPPVRDRLSKVDALLASGRTAEAMRDAASSLSGVVVESLDRADLEAAGHLANIAGTLAGEDRRAREWFELAGRCFEALHTDPLDWKSRVNAAIARSSLAALADTSVQRGLPEALSVALGHLEAALEVAPGELAVRREYARVLSEAVRASAGDGSVPYRLRLVAVSEGVDDEDVRRLRAEQLLWLAVDARQQRQQPVALARAREARLVLDGLALDDWYVTYLGAVADLEVAESGLAPAGEVGRCLVDALARSRELLESRSDSRSVRHLRVRALLAATAWDLRNDHRDDAVEDHLAEASLVADPAVVGDPELLALMVNMQLRAAIRRGRVEWLRQAETRLAALRPIADRSSDATVTALVAAADLVLSLTRGRDPSSPALISELTEMAERLRREGHPEQADLVASLIDDQARGPSIGESE